ncbi:ribonuclease H-like domain-containing protein [Tanacetum coccineum]
MRIGLDVPLHGALLLAIVSFLATIFYLGLPNDTLLFLDQCAEASIGVLPMHVASLLDRYLLRELHTPLSTATIVYCDNVSAVYLSSNPVQHQRTKHIEIDIHFVRDLVTTGHIRVLHVPSRYQYADIFTKGLPTALFDEFRDSLVFLVMIGSSTSMLIKLKIPKPNNTAVKEGKRVCSVCKKEFSSSKALGGHMRVHVMYHKNGDGLKIPFKSMVCECEGVPNCSQCGKSCFLYEVLFGHIDDVILETLLAAYYNASHVGLGSGDEEVSRGKKKMDDSDEDDEDLLEAVEDLMSLANGHRSSVIEGSNSNVNSPPSIDKRKAVMQVQMELDDHEPDSRNSDEKQLVVTYKCNKQLNKKRQNREDRR